jgi:serine phosphatase RsbU (regulator of sigma subunit)
VEGVPLGLLPDRDYEEITIQTQPGDVILLVSDGIPDQTNSAGEEYGRKRLMQAIKKAGLKPPEEIVSAVYADLEKFADTADAFDDQTIVVLKVN